MRRVRGFWGKPEARRARGFWGVSGSEREAWRQRVSSASGAAWTEFLLGLKEGWRSGLGSVELRLPVNHCFHLNECCACGDSKI